jgi:hypothetical protein
MDIMSTVWMHSKGGLSLSSPKSRRRMFSEKKKGCKSAICLKLDMSEFPRQIIINGNWMPDQVRHDEIRWFPSVIPAKAGIQNARLLYA